MGNKAEQNKPFNAKPILLSPPNVWFLSETSFFTASVTHVRARMFASVISNLIKALNRASVHPWLAALALFALNSAQALPPVVYTDVTTGSRHACGVLTTGSVQCWGANSSGQLGNNSSTVSSTAVDVIGVSNAVAVAAGGAHSCALIADGRVMCWGVNISGQLGDGTTTSRPTARYVLNITNATAISASSDVNGHTTCALLATGNVACWGNYLSGPTNITTPSVVAGLSGSTSISVSFTHLCAVRTGQVWCVGSNFYGQLGNNSTGSSTTPVQALGIATGATAVSAGSRHTCALVSGSVQCWGQNNAGQIGDGTIVGPRLSPTPVAGLSGVVSIAAGYATSCAVLSGGALRCWGENRSGQLGNSTGIGSTTPVAVHGIVDAVRIRLSEVFACLLRPPGTIDCWGENYDGSLGNGATLQSSVPVQVANLTGVTSVSAGSGGACAVSSGGTLRCWGVNRGDGAGTLNTGLPVPVAGITTAASVSVGVNASCALLNTNALMCWGDNSGGQLGTGNTTSSGTPVASVTGVNRVSTGSGHTCAIFSTFTSESVGCWGYGFDGQLGNGANGNSSVPVATGIIGSPLVSGNPYPIGVSAGGSHSCAVLSTGAVLCWGSGTLGQIGTNLSSSNVPRAVAMPSALAATHVVAGRTHSCARLSDGRVACWGDGQSTASFVAGISNASSVAAAALVLNVSTGGNTCAVLTDGKVMCWGGNANGQLGNGSTADSATPVFVTGISNATQVTVGTGFACARLADTTVKCWGDNSSGRLGDGNGAVFQLLPAPVLPSQCSMDIDGDGVVNPLTDGLLMTRAAAGMGGTTVTNNAVGSQATRRDWRGIRAYLQGPCGMAGLAP
jgi:alpha-tubulin suppressor-like RCC1 family protein